MQNSLESARWPDHVHWHRPALRWRQRPPARLLSWLGESGSLTARLQALSQGDLRVQVLREGWQRPTPEERRTLGLAAHTRAWVREVLLLGNDVAWVQARSVLPRSSLTGIGRRLTRLGNRSLGGLLFRDPALRRGEIAIARLRLGAEDVWARRSALQLHGHPVLVAEAFLPALWAADPELNG